jgi:hypothetical protein
VLIGSIVALFLAVILFFVGSFLLPLAMAQLQQPQQQQTTTPPAPSSSPSLSITTIPPLTPEEQEQQNRLQNVIAATTANLNETEKQVNGVIFTPRWSEPVWINANSIAVLIAYCLPGEFADSGQEILGGFELEVLESYAVALPQGFMAWMAVVGNQDEENVRLPAALGVICASDLNNADTRILSTQEQQQINNINQQFSTIQNTQITNIDQVINVINNVTETTTGEQPLRVEAFANATEAYVPVTIRFDSNVTGGTPPYSYTWRSADGGGVAIGYQRNLVIPFDGGGTDIIILNVTDSKGQTASDSIPIAVRERPLTNDTGTPTGQPLTVEGITNVTEAYGPVWIKFDANVTGGTPPYSYSWSDFGLGIIETSEKSFTQFFDQPSCNPPSLYCNEPFLFEIRVTDSNGHTASDSGGVNITIEPLTVEIIPNATSGFTLDRFELKSNVRGGTPPYTYSWIFSGDFQNFAAACNALEDPTAVPDNSCFVFDTYVPGEHQVLLRVDDSKGRASVDEILITLELRPPEGLLPGTLPPSNDTGEVISPPPPEGGVEEEGEAVITVEPTEEGPDEGEEESATMPQPPSDTGGVEEGTPPSSTTTEGEQEGET